MAAENRSTGDDGAEPKAFTIEIDGAKYDWAGEKITGAQIRGLPPNPIPSNRVLLQVIANQHDRLVKDDETIEVRGDLRFFTTPEEVSEDKVFTIRIDRTEYEWSDEKITGAQIRGLPPTPIPAERDVFQVVPGHADRKIKDDDTIEVHDGLRFFTAPNTINPGAERSGL